jgi:hypothetical protein
MQPWEKMTGWYAKGHFDTSIAEYGDVENGDIKAYINYTFDTRNALRNLDLLNIESLFTRNYR